MPEDRHPIYIPSMSKLQLTQPTSIILYKTAIILHADHAQLVTDRHIHTLYVYTQSQLTHTKHTCILYIELYNITPASCVYVYIHIYMYLVRTEICETTGFSTALL